MSARRQDRLEAAASEVRSEFGVPVRFFQLDVRDQAAVERAVSGLPPEWESIDVLVNNAGLSRGLDKLHEGDLRDWEEMIDTNVKGLLYVSRAVTPGMIRRGRGHIINIGSIAGHEVYPGGNVYCATKFAVNALSKGLRLDLSGTPLRVSTVDPGMVETEFSVVRFHGDQPGPRRSIRASRRWGPATSRRLCFCSTRPPTSTSAKSSSCRRPKRRRRWSTEKPRGSALGGHSRPLGFLVQPAEEGDHGFMPSSAIRRPSFVSIFSRLWRSLTMYSR